MGFLLAGTSAAIRYTAGRLYLSERDKTDTGFIEKANDVDTAQDGAHIKPAKYGESQYGKKKGEGNKKNGNKYLAWAYVEAANFMVRYSEPARRWYQRKAAKTNKIVAIKALSNKIARARYFIIKDQTPFDPRKLFQ